MGPSLIKRMEHTQIVSIAPPKGPVSCEIVQSSIMCERLVIVDGVVLTDCVPKVLEAHLLSRDVVIGCHISLPEVLVAERLVLLQRVVFESDLGIGHLQLLCLTYACLVAVQQLHRLIGFVLDAAGHLR